MIEASDSNGERAGREAAWLERWMESASRSGSMSQRRLSAIERHGGGLDAAARAAREAGVHLVLLTDDKGDRIVAASRNPFRVLA